MTVAKRVFDLAFAIPGVVVLLPVFAVVALWITLGDNGPVFFRQERVGRKGCPFRIWKFRTMLPNADREGRQITVGADARITRAGRWLRRFKLDELPQLFNVLAGEMSLVGPRPEVPRYVALYSAKERAVLGLLPGITDPASIRYRNENEILAQVADPDRFYSEELMPEKIQINLSYAAQATVWTDLCVILATIFPFARLEYFRAATFVQPRR